MKIAIFSPYATVVPHFETELDIAQQHLDAGDEVQFFNCTGKLANCDFNVERSQDRCDDCIGRRKMGLDMLSPQLGKANCQSFDSTDTTGLKTNFDSVQELIEYRIDNFDIGYAALSSIVSLCRDPEPNLVEQSKTLKRFLVSAFQTYRQAVDYLSNSNFDRVYVFNGRFAAMRAVFRACQKMKVDCYLHERGCDGEHYELFENHLPHNLVEIEKAIHRLWDKADELPERELIASQWFLDRVNRVEKVWHSFVKDQESGRLPPGFDSQKKNVSIFCSSDDEFVAIGDAWRNSIYPNQVTAIAKIAADMLAAQPETVLYLRVHPNLRQVDNQRKRDMLGLKFENLKIIPPDATVDTYELIRQSNTIVSFGSSVGSEAVFWGKPSVLLGPCFYQNLGGVYRSTSHSETIQLLTEDLSPLDKLGALKYGFWFQTRGHKHKYFHASGLFEGQFKGQTLFAKPEKLTGLKRLKKNARRLFQ